jgi:hypothetical protein
LEFGEKHYKCVSGIKSTFVKIKIKITKNYLNQMPWNLERSILSVSGIKSTFIGTN